MQKTLCFNNIHASTRYRVIWHAVTFCYRWIYGWNVSKARPLWWCFDSKSLKDFFRRDGAGEEVDVYRTSLEFHWCFIILYQQWLQQSLADHCYVNFDFRYSWRAHKLERVRESTLVCGLQEQRYQIVSWTNGKQNYWGIDIFVNLVTDRRPNFANVTANHGQKRKAPRDRKKFSPSQINSASK